MHTLAGGLTGGVAGAAGAGLSAATIPDIARAIEDLGLPEGVSRGLIAAAGTAVGAVVGGTQGTASGLNQTINNYLKHDEIEALANARKTCSTSGANSAACGEVKRLEALDKQRDIAVNACSGNASAACDTVRQDVRKAAADIVRYGTARSDLLSPVDSQHTKDMAPSTMSSVDEVKGRAAGLASGTGAMVKDLTEVFFKLLQASTGGDQAQEDIARGFGNILKLMDPVTLSQVIEAESTERRNAIADAYERGDSFALGTLTGDLLSAVVPFPAGTIGKASKAGKAAGDVADIVKRVEKASDHLGKAANRENSVGVPATRSENPLSSVLERDVHGNEIMYRTMSKEQYLVLKETGRLSPSTETSISPDVAYSSKYDGVTVKFTTAPGTSAQLQEIGIAANRQASAQFPNMSTQTGSWTQTNARFKGEGGQMTTQLGQGKAIEIFNKNIVDFELVRKGAK